MVVIFFNCGFSEPNNELTLEDVNNTNKVSLQRSVSEIAEEVGRGGGSRRFERGQGNGNVKVSVVVTLIVRELTFVDSRYFWSYYS